MESEITLKGINGSNPLAYMAALGALRVLHLVAPEDNVRMSWQSAGVWMPVIRLSEQMNEDEVVEAIYGKLAEGIDNPAFGFANNLKVEPGVYRDYIKRAVTVSGSNNRSWADFASAIGCESVVGSTGFILDTEFRTMSGAGHQHFIKNMRNIMGATNKNHIWKALFENWMYDDPLENLSMRWDPMDDQRYAMRWSNPSGDASRRKQGSVLGANRLAIEALPLFPAVPVKRSLKTTGFKGNNSRNTFWTWPIWEPFAGLDTVRSLLTMKELQDDYPAREQLAARGIAEVFRSQRLTTGKFRNFTMGQPV